MRAARGVPAVGVAVGGLPAAGRRSRVARAATACALVPPVRRVHEPRPTPRCWEYDGVGRDDDGTYDCLTR
ncbi:hypothetical protein [Streptomyces sp. NPDC006368]|uniref:hypothetical protein n=1 Tax=Streptomyces sp. NPDC006368 TaxID=3156760 RepID=UPI0033AD9727